MASKAKKDQPAMAGSEITIFGETVELIELTGLDGLDYLASLQGAMAAVLDQAGALLGNIDSEVVEIEMSPQLFRALRGLLKDDDFRYVVLPGLLQWSSLRLSKEKAIAKIQSQKVTTATVQELFNAFFAAYNFWSGVGDEEALDEAQKK